MAKKRYKEIYDEDEGVWRTIGGRKVFIKTGQSLSDAMKESGKFNKASDIKREKYQTLKDEFALENKINEKIKKDPEYKDLDYDEETYELDRRLETRYNPKEYTGNLSDLKGKHIAKNEDYLKLSDKQIEAGNRLNVKAENGVRDDIKLFLSGQEDYDGSQNDFIRDLSNEWGVDKDRVEDILHEENSKHPRLFKTDRPANSNDRDEELRKYKQDMADFWERKAQRTSDDASITKQHALETAKRLREDTKIANEKEDLHFAGEKLYSDDPNRFGDKMRKYNDSINPSKKAKKDAFDFTQEEIENSSDNSPYIKTLEKHGLNNYDPQFKRMMLGRFESDINYYLGNGSGYTGHLWAKDEDEHINIMKALYNTLPEKEKPDWINEAKIEEYSKKMQKLKSSNLKVRFKSTYEYMKNNTTMSESEILNYLRKLKNKN